MPAAVFPQGEFRREDADERNRGDLHSPATVFPELALCDHFPLVLTLPCDHTRNLHKQGKMALDGLTEELWIEKNAGLRKAFEIAGLLREDGEPLPDRKTLDINRYYFTMEKVRARVFREQTKKVKAAREENPHADISSATCATPKNRYAANSPGRTRHRKRR